MPVTFRSAPRRCGPVRGAAVLAVCTGLLAITACSSSEDAGPTADGPDTTTTAAAVIDPGDGGDYQPELDPEGFLGTVDNPYFPLAVGSRWVYEGGGERVVVEVTDETYEVMGIDATVVRDTVHADGELVEDTFDWFAQDADGNVWYLGEDSTTYENGQPADTEGSWEAGVDGALPGIIMPADPAVGDAYRQEYYPGEAEDMAEVRRVGEERSTPAGDYVDVVVTGEWTPLEPAIVEEKYYAPGVGNIASESIAGEQEHLELVSFTPGA